MPIDPEIQRLLKEVVDHFDKEDRSVRERQIRIWRKLKYYWAGFQQTWWSEVAHDWRVFDIQAITESYQDSAYYDKPVNIFRAYLESIIAALSVTVPPVQCFPDDADNPLDLSTAKAGDYISKQIFRHNDAPLLWLHALFIFCTEGMAAAYNYTKEDDKFGTYDVDEYKNFEEVETVNVCPICQTNIPDEAINNAQQDKFDPSVSDINTDQLIDQLGAICPNCMQLVNPELQTEPVIVTRLVGRTSRAKSRQCIEVYGGLNVKVPIWARNQDECLYLIYAYETHYANVLAKYGDLRESLTRKDQNKLNESLKQGGMYDPYEQSGRLSTQYYGDYPVDNVTVRNAWLRPCAFDVLGDENNVKKLKDSYPDGVKVILCNEFFADAKAEVLDDHWTLTYNPLADYVYFDPIGLLLISVQDITNELISLTLQTIEHGIPQTFADPNVLNFNQYNQTETAPGMIFPAKPTGGKSIGDAFYQISTANLSSEVLPFGQSMQELGQLTSGALPSLFGGSQEGGGKTASQYAMSRAQALQRLQNTWKVLSHWWKNVFGKVIPAYMQCVQEDERYVEKNSDGNFVNVFIRKAELAGKIGSVELETSEELPVSWQQKKDVVMQLLNAGNPMTIQALMSPENLPLIAKAIGLEELVLPGIDDRQKQYEEIQLLAKSEPFMLADGMEQPSVDIDPLIDNHAIQAEICRIFLMSEKGRLLKLENEMGYKNILLHMQRHVVMGQILAQANAAPQMQGPQGNDAIAAQGNRNGQPEPEPELT